MAETLHRSSNIPDFDTYPSSPRDQFLRGHERSSLEEYAADLGTAAGKAVVGLHQAIAALESLPESLRRNSRIGALADNVVARMHHLRELAASRMEGIYHAAQETGTELAQQTRENYFRARRRANTIVREHPVEVALAAGIAGLLLGVGLRLGRNRVR